MALYNKWGQEKTRRRAFPWLMGGRRFMMVSGSFDLPSVPAEGLSTARSLPVFKRMEYRPPCPVRASRQSLKCSLHAASSGSNPRSGPPPSGCRAGRRLETHPLMMIVASHFHKASMRVFIYAPCCGTAVKVGHAGRDTGVNAYFE